MYEEMKEVVESYAEEGRSLPHWGDRYEGESWACLAGNGSSEEGCVQRDSGDATFPLHEQGTSNNNSMPTENGGDNDPIESKEKWEDDDSEVEDC
ncbi:hypothetical protein ACA910_001829 [Epithemia clementina (nom. ined.)]